MIKLKGELEHDLLSLGLMPGDEVNANPDPISKVGGMHFTVNKYGYGHNCSVWPENYEIVSTNIKQHELVLR